MLPSHSSGASLFTLRLKAGFASQNSKLVTEAALITNSGFTLASVSRAASGWAISSSCRAKATTSIPLRFASWTKYLPVSPPAPKIRTFMVLR